VLPQNLFEEGRKPPVKFGISFFPSVGPADKSATAYFDEALRLAELADQLGYDHVRTVEHYFFHYGGYSPDPTTLLAAIAARTKHIRLTSAAVIPAFSHPIKLAGKLAMLDNLSHGRLDVGFGRAFLPEEFEAFQVSMDESRPRFDEGVEACRRLWSEENVRWDGQFYQFGPVTLLPRPVQRPHPPIFVAAAKSEESYEIAGREGHHLQTVLAVSSKEKTQETLRTYRDAWRGAGHEPGAERIQISLPFFVHEDRDQAYRLGAIDYEKNTENIAAAVSAWSRTSSDQYAGYEKILDGLRNTTYDDRIEQHKMIVGNPDDVREQLETIVDWFGDDISIALVTHSGILDVEVWENALRLFSDRVAPKLGS
jgi:natural product biosynthesis luciferase-like monooxygenase protein